VSLQIDKPAFTGQPPVELPDAVVTSILRVVEAGWADALKSPDVNSEAGEVAINERLRDGMRRAVDSGRFSTSMIVLPGTESRSHPGVIVPDGRTDIPILVIQVFSKFRGHDPNAIVECKRISGSRSDLCREYVINGIDRFRKGKYGRFHLTGFMVGYLIANDASVAACGINRHLNRKSRNSENLKPSELIPEAWVRRSTHPREGNPAIELHHVFLSFENL